MIKTLEQVGLKSVILFLMLLIYQEFFEKRMKHTRNLLKTMNLDHIRWVEQKRCNSEKELLNFLNRIEAKVAEGLMLRKPGSQYKTGRSANLLKVKSFQENVGTVIQHLP